ncbi:MAG TPA: beta-ketoacyl synthase N-terminal-like domain-containing protein, partial [Rudaea sp.]|nr:beta-ketoacyl synthase N-terminal-like domain-containing protein [Rudaea sp.]
MRRVAITGMGAICALGHDARSTWAAMREGRGGIAPIENIATDVLNVNIAAEVRGFDPAAHIDAKRLPLLDRVSQFALVAAREAVTQSGLDFKTSGLGERTACIIGTGIGGESSHNEQ